jgi:hypothetical protein
MIPLSFSEAYKMGYSNIALEPMSIPLPIFGKVWNRKTCQAPNSSKTPVKSGCDCKEFPNFWDAPV